MIGWCYFEVVNEDNITMIKTTPMITIPNSNCSVYQKEYESFMEGIFETASACTITSTIYDYDNDSDSDNVSSSLNWFIGTFDTYFVSFLFLFYGRIEYVMSYVNQKKSLSLILYLYLYLYLYLHLHFFLYYIKTCYYSFWYPLACSHGYLPRIVDNESVVWSEEVKSGNTNIPPIPFCCFNCCLIYLPPTISVNRHCSNSTILTNNKTTNIWEDDTARPYAQKMASFGSTESFLCCDSVSNNNTISFLNDTECVPFINELCSPAKIIKKYGYTPLITCDNINIYTDFKSPRKVTEKIHTVSSITSAVRQN